MEETGSVASWLGSGESLPPRILTVDEVVELVRQLVFDELSHEQVSALTEITTRVLDRLAATAG